MMTRLCTAIVALLIAVVLISYNNRIKGEIEQEKIMLERENHGIREWERGYTQGAVDMLVDPSILEDKNEHK